MKAIRPLLLIDYVPSESIDPDAPATVLSVHLPDGTLLFRQMLDGNHAASLSAFERLTACEACEP